MTIGDLVKRLVLAGCDPVEASAVVAETYALGFANHFYVAPMSPNVASDKKQRKRERDRARMHAKRERHLATVARDIGDTTDNAELLASDKSDKTQNALFLSKKVSKKESKRKKGREYEGNQTTKSRSSRGTLCPPDWRPTDRHYFAAQEYDLTREAVDKLADEMREWSHANANRPVARKADWGLAFHSWLRRGRPRIPPKPGMSPQALDLARRTEEYRAKLAREKSNGEQEPTLRSAFDGSGDESADTDGDDLFPKGESIH